MVAGRPAGGPHRFIARICAGMAHPTTRGTGRQVFASASLLAAMAISAACIDDNVPDARPDAWLIERFKSEAVLWIRAERERNHRMAAPLSEQDRRALSPYFPRDVLGSARILVVEGFANPDFFSIFEESGEPYPVDLRKASAISLGDTILVARAASESSLRDRLLFHELVHTMQYEILGLEEYMEGYVEGWARNGRRYRRIPHEEQAFELATRFWSGAEPFSVEAEVRSLFAVVARTTQE